MAINIDDIRHYQNSIKALMERLETPERFTRKQAESVLAKVFTYETISGKTSRGISTYSWAVSVQTLIKHDILKVVDKEEFPITPKKREKKNVYKKYCIYNTDTDEYIKDYDWKLYADMGIRALRSAIPNHKFEIRHIVPPMPKMPKTVIATRYYYTIDERRLAVLIDEAKYNLVSKQKTLARKLHEIENAINTINQLVASLDHQENHA